MSRLSFALAALLVVGCQAAATVENVTVQTPLGQAGVVTCLPGQPCSCGANKLCTLSCFGDGCDMDCGASICTANCSGKSCRLKCGEIGFCTLNCLGGRCDSVCGPGSLCTTNCAHANCDTKCQAGARCTHNCRKGDLTSACEPNSRCALNCERSKTCDCNGPGCPKVPAPAAPQ
jgi:hypothetical protein